MVQHWSNTSKALGRPKPHHWSKETNKTNYRHSQQQDFGGWWERSGGWVVQNMALVVRPHVQLSASGGTEGRRTQAPLSFSLGCFILASEH